MATLIFDLDGTLLDCRERHYAVYADVLRELDFDPLSESLYWRRRLAGEGTFALVDKLPPDAARTFRLEWMNRIERRDYLAIDSLLPGAIEALAELSQQHHMVMLTLRRDAYALDWQLAKTGLIEFFHEIISPAGLAPSRKSQLLADWYPMGDTYVIGDSEADVDLASDLGARCLCVTTGVRSQAYVYSWGATLTFDSIAELPDFLHLPPGPRGDNRFAVPVARGRF